MKYAISGRSAVAEVVGVKKVTFRSRYSSDDRADVRYRWTDDFGRERKDSMTYDLDQAPVVGDSIAIEYLMDRNVSRRAGERSYAAVGMLVIAVGLVIYWFVKILRDSTPAGFRRRLQKQQKDAELMRELRRLTLKK